MRIKLDTNHWSHIHSPIHLHVPIIRYNWSRSCFSPDGCFIVAGSLNGSVLIFDAAEGGGQTSNMSSSQMFKRKSDTAGSGGGGGGGGGGRFGGFGEAFGNALGSALGKANLGNTIGNTLGGTIGSTLVNVSSASENEVPSTPYSRSASGIRCHSQLRSHEAAVTSTTWSPGTSGWQQVASVDKMGNLFIWD
jgi:WD40 repeat protein